MKMALLVAFALFLIGVLSGLAWRRGRNKGPKADLVAKSNHKSVWSFHYGPASVIPIRETAKVSPRSGADSPLSQLIPEDIEAKEQQVKAEETARVEEAQALENEVRPQPTEQADEAASTPAATAVSSTATIPKEAKEDPVRDTPAAQLLSSRHAPGAKLNVLDMLGTDEAATAKIQATAAAEVNPGVGEEPAQPAGAKAEDAPVPATLFNNPLTEATGTKNDEANRQAAVELKKRKRAALRTGTDGQKAALAALITEAAAPG
ncbi:hypothetical protein LJY25_18805 [Hymenobacter sp. BT175]|uniref:hypothetical protein n=1 Tax=Hymenobacter translucens TaxID=2886507 RepID=UPI001D0EF9D2|nr:hypothetical protein [Hymenobacter translucens]MCC2548505.1 hypothetical protein [Hymenobacter translucens]